MLYKIKNREGKYFQKIVGNVYELRNGDHFKKSEWNNKGSVLNEKELQAAIKRLTQIAKPTCVRPYPIYPTYSVEDLEIITFSEEQQGRRSMNKRKTLKISLLEKSDCRDAILIFNEYRFNFTKEGNTFYFDNKEEGIHAKTLLDEEGFAFEWSC